MKIAEVRALEEKRAREYGPPPINQEIASKTKSFQQHMDEHQTGVCQGCGNIRRLYQYDRCEPCLVPHLRVMTEVIDRWR